MLSEMGNFFLAMALGFASVQVLASFWGVVRCNVSALLRSEAPRNDDLPHPSLRDPNRTEAIQSNFLTLGHITTFLQGGFIAVAFLTLITAFLICDFFIVTVALNDHTYLPWYYRMAAAWGNHEGSLLLFILILSGIGMGFALFLRDPLYRARALTIQGLLIFLFLIFLIMTSNPFATLPTALPEGQSLNPLLQDRGLLFHPPHLYLGYVGFSAPFSLALAALWGGGDVDTWNVTVRPWVLLAWGALTAGIALGSWWAYYELGWGGWWFWDPVENVSLMPWLTGTALLHTLRTKTLFRWSLFLCILTFGLSLLGTFLVRSGLIASVHSFAQDPERGFFILCLIGGVMSFALFLWIWKAPHFEGSSISFFSRQGTLLLNSLLLCVGLGTVFLGTLYPLWSEWVWGKKIAIGAPYFERTFIPLMIPFLLLLPIGSVLRGKQEPLFQLLSVPLTATLGGAALLLFVFNPTSLWVFTGIVVAIWVLTGTGAAFIKKQLALGSALAHLGVGITLLGVSVGGGFRSDQTHTLGIKESFEVGGLKLTLQSVQQGKGPNYLYEKATLTTPGGILTPEKRLYQPQNSLLSETAILTNGLRDLYVILGPYQGDNRWLIRASLIPLAPWIWSGGFLMVLGAFFSLIGSKFSRLVWLLRSLAMTNRGSVIASPAKSRAKQSRVKYLLLLIFFALPMSSWANVSRETKAQALYKEVRCPECAGQSIAESESAESIALRGFIDEQLKKGKSEEAIRDELRTLFGDDILFRPPFQANTYFLWLAPFVFFSFILAVFLWKVYRYRPKK